MEEARLNAALRAAYPDIDTWEHQEAIDDVAIRMEQALDAADRVMFADEYVSKCYPFVHSFLKRRGYVPRGKEVGALVGYVITGLRGGYDVE